VSTHLSLEAMDAFRQVCEHLGITSISSTEEGLFTKDAFERLSASGKPFEADFEAVKDSDCYLVIGEDLTKDHQVISFFIKRGLPVGGKLIQISSSETGFDHFATHSLRVPNDQTANFLSALEGLIKSGSQKDVGNLAKEYKLEAQLLADAVNSIQSASKFAVIVGSRHASNNSASAFSSAVSIAKQRNGRFISTKGNINSLACAQMGMDNSVDVNGAEVVFVAAGDEKLSQQFIKKFEKVPHLIVLSSYSSPLTAAAEFVLPVANWLEQGGHFMNFSGSLLEAHPSLKSDEDVLSNHETLVRMAGKLGLTIKPLWKETIQKKSLVS